MSSDAPPPPPPPPPGGFQIPSHVLGRGSVIVTSTSNPHQGAFRPRAESTMITSSAPTPPPPPPALTPISALSEQTHHLSVTNGGSNSRDRRSFSMVPISGTTIATPPPATTPTASSSSPAMTSLRHDVNVIFESGRTAFSNLKEFKTVSTSKKLDPDGRLVAMINRLWYRFAYLSNAKYVGPGTDLMKEVMMVLTILCEIRQTVIDVFEFSKNMGDKVSQIMSRHVWLFETALKMENLVGQIAMRVTQQSGLNRGSATITDTIPDLLDAPLALFEDRLALLTAPQQQALFEECGNLKSLRSQIESYLAAKYEPAVISLFITEAVGKAIELMLPQKEKRKLYLPSLLAIYSVARANSWMLLRSNHSIDLSKTGATKLATSRVSISANATTSTISSMPTGGLTSMSHDLLTLMMNGIAMTGYFQIPNSPEPVIERMVVWYDLIDGTANGNPDALIGKKGALYYVQEKRQRVKSHECALPIADITDILLGKQTTVFQTSTGSRANGECCVTLVAQGGYSLNFEASNKEALTQWMSGLTRLVNAAGKRFFEDNLHSSTSTQSTLASSNTTSSQSSSTSASQPIQVHSPPLLSATTGHHKTNSSMGGSVNGGWTRCTSETGAYYYYHAETNRSVWEKPIEFTVEPYAIGAAASTPTKSPSMTKQLELDV